MKQAAGSRMAADERRSQIIRIAVQLFSQKGFGGTTTREIAQAAGVSEAIIFRHFATKHELYKAILDFQICEGGNANKLSETSAKFETKDDFAIFYNFALGALRHHKENEEFMRLLFYSALENHELSQMFFDRFIARVYDVFSSYIVQRQKDGAFRSDIEPMIVVRAFISMLIHHSLTNLLWDKEQRLVKISEEEAARQFTEILLDGVRAKDQA